MNKPFRFMVEYANYQRKSWNTAENINKGIKDEMIRRVDHAILMYERGYITVDECMRLLSAPDTGEDMSEYMTA